MQRDTINPSDELHLANEKFIKNSLAEDGTQF